MGCWAVTVDAGGSRKMGRLDTSLTPFQPVARQQICCGSRGRSLEVVGDGVGGKTVKNKIEFYNILRLDLKLYL